MAPNRRHYLCMFDNSTYFVGDYEIEVICPNFQLRPSPPSEQKLTKNDVWEILSPFPPFAEIKSEE